MKPEPNYVAGYDAAIAAISAQGNFIWASFASQSQVHAIFIGLSGLLLESLPAVSIAISLPGVALCALWLMTVSRQFDYHSYWVAQGRGLESAAYGDAVRLLRTGQEFSAGDNILALGEGTARRISWAGRQARVRTLAQYTIIGFVVIYLVIVAVALT